MGNVEDFQQNSKGEWIGPETAGAWLRPCPRAFRDVLRFLHNRYHTKIHVTENGTSIKGENDLPIREALEDTFRCNSFKGHVEQLVKARNEDSVDVRIYLAWSLLDNFEWQDSYEVRFGMTYMDYKDRGKRYPKRSTWFLGETFNKLIEK
jgi:beta-glucosidase